MTFCWKLWPEIAGINVYFIKIFSFCIVVSGHLITKILDFRRFWPIEKLNSYSFMHGEE